MTEITDTPSAGGEDRREIELPTVEAVRAALSPLSRKQLEALAERSGVPFPTLWKVRSGETANPGLDTCRKFLPHVAGVLADVAPTGRRSAAEPGAAMAEASDAAAG